MMDLFLIIKQGNVCFPDAEIPTFNVTCSILLGTLVIGLMSMLGSNKTFVVVLNCSALLVVSSQLMIKSGSYG